MKSPQRASLIRTQKYTQFSNKNRKKKTNKNLKIKNSIKPNKHINFISFLCTFRDEFFQKIYSI